jgi:hypothetical protein
MALRVADPPAMVVEGEAAEDPHPANTAEEARAARMVHALRTDHGRVVVPPIGAPPI